MTELEFRTTAVRWQHRVKSSTISNYKIVEIRSRKPTQLRELIFLQNTELSSFREEWSPLFLKNIGSYDH